MSGKNQKLSSAAQILQSLFEDKGSCLSPGFQCYRLEKEWSEVVGDKLSLYTRPLGFHNNRLTVAVKNSGLITELQFFRETLIDKINQHTGYVWVHKIRFIIE